MIKRNPNNFWYATPYFRGSGVGGHIHFGGFRDEQTGAWLNADIEKLCIA
jgi:hypothetical protein